MFSVAKIWDDFEEILNIRLRVDILTDINHIILLFMVVVGNFQKNYNFAPYFCSLTNQKDICRMRKSREKYFLYLGVCVALLPILLMRDFTPSNELRYLSIADEALRNHVFFAFTNHGVPYADKPPLYFWIVMMCRWLIGSHRMWLLALFSLLPALGIVRVMDGWAARETDGEGRALARLMLSTSGLFIGVAMFLRMDMLMSLFIVLALRSFWRMYEGTEGYRRERWLFPSYIFLAMFTKGVLGLFIPLCSTAVFLLMARRIRFFLRFWGWRTWSVLLVCCALWFGAVYAEGGYGYLRDLLVRQTVGRAVSSFSHDEPFYYYLICVWYCLAPWSPLIIGVTVASLRPRFVRGSLQLFFQVVGLTTFLLLSCVSAKLQIYMLPAIPFMVYSAVMLIHRFRDRSWLRASVVLPAAIFAVAFPVLAFVASLEEMSYLDDGMIYAAAMILTLCGLSSLKRLCRAGWEDELGGVLRRMGAGLLLAVFVGAWSLPRLNAHIGYGELCAKALEVSRSHGISDIRTWHISRPEGMDVYLHRGVAAFPKDNQPVIGNNRPMLLLTRKRYLEHFKGLETHTVEPYAVVVCP